MGIQAAERIAPGLEGSNRADRAGPDRSGGKAKEYQVKQALKIMESGDV